MSTSVGALDISSLWAANFQTVSEYGIDKVVAVLQADMAVHNQLVQEMLSDFCEMTTERQIAWGTSAQGEMVEVDEYGRAPGQRPQVGNTGAFPLRSFQYNLGWTEKWMQSHSPKDLATAYLAGQKAHLKRIQREIKTAVYLSSNFTFNDHLIDKVDLAVKRFVNADSANIPEGPNGETFDGTTHTHYDAIATLTAATLKASINDVVEHGHGMGVRTAINKADEATVRALTGFQGYPDPRVIYRASDTPATTLDITRLDNRAIGIFEGSEIWVKPWAIAYYAYTWAEGVPDKGLAFRQRAQTTLQGLRIAALNSAFPLTAQYMEAEFGIGVLTRTNGAVLFFNNATYTDPTIS